MAFFEISTTKYDEDIKSIQLHMNKMAALCNVSSGFKFWRSNFKVWLDVFPDVRRSGTIRGNGGQVCRHDKEKPRETSLMRSL